MAAHRFPDPKRALAGLLEEWGAGLAGSRAERRMALRGTDDRLRLILPPPLPEEEPETVVPGDDDEDAELGAPFPGEEPGEDPGDFYADAMETA